MEKEPKALLLVSEMLKQGKNAREIRAALLQIDANLLSYLNQIPRTNIREFITSTSASTVFQSPVIDLGAGYRSNKSEAISSLHNQELVYFTLDHVIHPNAHNQSCWPNIIADTMNIPLKDRSVGTVICTELLEHVPNHLQVIDEVARVLKPRGLLLLSVPGKDIPNHEKLPFQHDYRRFTVEEILQLLSSNFSKISVTDHRSHGFQINIFAQATKC